MNATESGQTVTQGSGDAVEDNAPVITQKDSSTPTDHTVTITAAENATANVTLDGVNIDTSSTDKAAVEIKGNGDVVIELDGTNTVQSGDMRAGVEKNTIAATGNDPGNGNGKLTIADGNKTAGSLKATGGDFGAGIGGGYEGNASNITISGGKVEATGFDGAGIGGGGNGGSGSNITITGSAEVTAKAIRYGAGIGGGGEQGAGIGITISGSAEVNAQGGMQGGSGIGGGASGTGSNITISGGKVEATGGGGGSGIGGGILHSGSSITITGSAEVTAKSNGGSGIGGGIGGSGSSITITGNAEVTANGGSGCAGIGGGASGTGSSITISGSAEVTAKGGLSGSGIGGGEVSTGSDITISGDAKVKAQGGEQSRDSSSYFGVGAAIGDGGKKSNSSQADIDGEEKAPNTDKLTPNGMIEYYAPGADMEKDGPIKTVTGTYVPPQPTEPVQTTEPAQPLYRVISEGGKGVACETERKNGILTITVEEDSASLTGYLGGLQALSAQGIDTIVFVTNGVTSTFAVADLMASMTAGDSYTLTHDGSTVTFTLGTGTDISGILK